MKRSFLAALLLLVVALASPAFADRAELQLGYVYSAWDSNFIASGSESRIPASLRFSSGNFNLSADSAFVVGDYKAAATDTSLAEHYEASRFSDGSLSMGLNFQLAPSLISSVVASANLGLGDSTWEGRSANGSTPYLFESSYYHGRGWGGSLFASVASSEEAFQWGVGAGYLLTTTYDVGLAGQSNFNPGDSLLVMGSLGGNVSATEKLSARGLHTFAFQSKVTDPSSQFSSAESTVMAGQWLSRLGADRLALNLSYSFYGRGMVADPVTQQQVREDSNFLGDRLEFRPALAYQAGPGVALETGLVWERIFPNGYPDSDTLHFEGGGHLLGAEQSVTFRMDRGMFLNFAGLYHYILNEKAALDDSNNLTNVTYNRFTFGTNVGFQW